jgi:hypothetical protein
MDLNTLWILLSSLSFFAYVLSYFVSPHMKNEFERFGVQKLGLLTIVLEFLGAAGLLVGLIYAPILLLSSFGLALLMLLAVLFRLKQRDSLWISLPALFFMGLNFYIFWVAVQ